MPARLSDDSPLVESLNPLIHLETASIGAIEAATVRQDEPSYVFLYQETKTSKQANVEQMMTVLRMRDERPTQSGGMTETIARMQTAVAQTLGTTPTLRAMRVVEERLIADYRALVDALDEGTLRHRAMQKVMERAVKHWHVLTAHIAKRERDTEEASRLPHPLAMYFTGAEAKACMRCLFDRAGGEPAIEKRRPHPYTYICSACHDEVLADFPPDLLAQASRWPEEVRRNRVAERALSRPEKLRAMMDAVALLSGLEPKSPVPTIAKTPPPHDVATVAPPVDANPPFIDLPRDGSTPGEQAYTDMLFDFASVRRNW